MANQPLDEILSGNADTPATPEPKPDPKPAPTEKPSEERPRGEHGHFAPKSVDRPEGQPAVAPAVVPPTVTEPTGAPPGVLEERRKRQEREDELKGVRAELAAIKAALPKPAPVVVPEPPAFWDDPDAFLEARLAPLRQQQIEAVERIAKREAIKEHGGEVVQAAWEALTELAKTDPQAASMEARRMQAADNSYGELVRWHKKQQAAQEIGEDPVAYRERVKAELLAELQGGQPAAPQRGNPAPAVMPSNLAGARNAGVRTGPEWGGPTPIKDIFNRGRAA